MENPELKWLFKLPREQRLQLADLLRRSTHDSDEVRVVPINDIEAQRARECLEDWVRECDRAEQTKVVEV